MRWLLAAAAVLALASCKPVGDDGYTYTGDGLDRMTSTITIVPYENLDRLQYAADKLGVTYYDEEHKRDGFGFGFVRGDKCEIHVVDPTRDRTEFGHEALHCFEPNWHE